ncbi:hypothetical protein ACXX82_05645 [Glaciimonas sp. GNP009]
MTKRKRSWLRIFGIVVMTIAIFIFCIFLSVVVFYLIVSNTKDDSVKQLHSNDGKATFTLPVKYEADDADKNLITFAFHYPSMEPIRPGKAPEKDEVEIYLSPTSAPDRSSANYAKNMEDNAIDHFDPTRRGLEYRIGYQGIYRMYQLGNPNKPDSLSTYYIFQAADEQAVRVQDPLPWTFVYIAHRTIDYRFDVQYTIAKPIGKDFVKIDEVVKTLIDQNTIIQPPTKE